MARRKSNFSGCAAVFAVGATCILIAACCGFCLFSSKIVNTASSEPPSVAVDFIKAEIEQFSTINSLGGIEVTRDRGLIVSLYITNSTRAKKMVIQSWTGFGDALVSDEHGNEYRHIQPRFAVHGSFQLNPGEARREQLFFERPVRAAKKLKLQLSRLNHGQFGTHEFTFDTPPFPGDEPKKTEPQQESEKARARVEIVRLRRCRSPLNCPGRHWRLFGSPAGQG